MSQGLKGAWLDRRVWEKMAEEGREGGQVAARGWNRSSNVTTPHKGLGKRTFLSYHVFSQEVASYLVCPLKEYSGVTGHWGIAAVEQQEGSLQLKGDVPGDTEAVVTTKQVS